MTFPWKPGIDFHHDQDFEEVLTNPFLDIAARFWDEPRYQAFRICYRSMRRIDDLVDDRKAAGTALSADEVTHYRGLIEAWIDRLRSGDTTDPFLSDFQPVLQEFSIPCWPWERLANAMIYDLDHDGFARFSTFLRYSEGAAISPAAVFMHLCGVQEREDGTIAPPAFDIRRACRPLALFSYLVHIIRDFEIDHKRGLNYYADEHLGERGLSREHLRAVAEGGEIPESLRDLMRLYRRLADYYRRKARATLDAHRGMIGPKYRLSLEVIYGLYSLVFERFDPDQGRFAATELNPEPGEIIARLQQVVSEHHSQ